MIPIAPTIFWGPMAYAIMGGLAGATALTLVFLPALYVAWYRIERPRPVDSQNMNIEPLPEFRLGDRKGQGANAAVPELETTAHPSGD